MLSTPYISTYIEFARHKAQLDFARTGLPFILKERVYIQRYNKSSYGSRLDRPRIRVSNTMEFSSKSDYYALMEYTGGCKDPFCDRKCPLTLTKQWDHKDPHSGVRLGLDRKFECGPVLYLLEVRAKLPETVWKYLLAKEIVQPFAEAHTESGFNIHCNI